MNLPQQLQEFLNYPPLQLIDINNGMPEDEKPMDVLHQSVLITFLTGLYKATRSTENATVITYQTDAGQLLDIIFIKDNQADTIAAFTNQPVNVIKVKLTEVSAGWLEYLKKQTLPGETQSDTYLKDLMTSQRHEILKYIPQGLKLGELLNDEGLEDVTNKMEGPVSSLMHMIENGFSTTD